MKSKWKGPKWHQNGVWNKLQQYCWIVISLLPVLVAILAGQFNPSTFPVTSRLPSIITFPWNCFSPVTYRRNIIKWTSSRDKVGRCTSACCKLTRVNDHTPSTFTLEHSPQAFSAYFHLFCLFLGLCGIVRLCMIIMARGPLSQNCPFFILCDMITKKMSYMSALVQKMLVQSIQTAFIN